MERISESYHEEEALEDVSLCDLPLLNSLTKEEEEDEKDINKNKKNQAPNDAVFEPQEEFAFGSVAGGMLAAGPEMCAADEVFFRGQILPLRPLVGSDTINPTRPNSIQYPTRSESMERGSLTGFRSISRSSSSSNTSYHSTTNPEAGSMGTTLKAITRVTSEPRLRTRNQFHTHPSPKPHIRASSARSSATGTTTGARLDRASSAKIKHKSSVWDFFRLGLVRTPPPDIELQEIRAYLRSNSRAAGKGVSSSNTTPVSRSSSGGGGGNNNDNNFNDNTNTTTNIASSTSSSANGTTTSENSAIVEKQKRRKFLSGCKCSAEAVASNAIVAKNKGNSNENNNINGISTRRLSNGTRLEKLLLLEEDHRLMIKMKNNNNYEYSKKKQSGRDNHDDHDDDDDQKQKKQYLKKDQGRRKQAHHVSHHRTYEWLKELSHANLAMHV